jgi:NAD(P)-dependent dehydrogenase (short-subunit alcohol dehydrogenase family)
VAGQLIDAYRPAILVLNAGATPLPRPIHHHTWQTFSSNWDTDVQHVFNFTREALLAPLAGTPGPRPLSGSLRPTPPRSRRGPGSASGSSRCSPS